MTSIFNQIEENLNISQPKLDLSLAQLSTRLFCDWIDMTRIWQDFKKGFKFPLFYDET